MSALSRQVIILLTVVVFADSQGNSACSHVKFIREPPDELKCNPFDQRSMWRLQLECKIEILDNTSYKINWYHRHLNETNDLMVSKEQRINMKIKSVFGEQWINTTFNNSMLGEYWCQVMNNSNINMYGISNVLTIHDPESYMSLDRCSGVQYINSSKCADSLTNLTSITSICSLAPSSTVSRVLKDSTFQNSQTNTGSNSNSQTNNDNSPTITEVLNSSKTNSTLLTIFSTHSVMYISITHIVLEITSNSTSLSTSHSQDDQEIDSGLTNPQTVIIISALIIIFGILMITSCLVMSCLYFRKRKKYKFKGDNCESTAEIQQSKQSGFNSSLPLAEPVDYLHPVSVQMAVQDESQTVVLSTSNEPVYNKPTLNNELRAPRNEPYYSVVIEGNVRTGEECYDRLKHNELSYEMKTHRDEVSNEEYSKTSSIDLHSFHTNISKEEQCDIVEHTGSGNNHVGSNDGSTTIDINSHVFDVLIMDMGTVFDNPNYTSVCSK